ncbi:arfaptin-2 [Condylostylus longicornis]|uniref:arfaptin-2 n=1 Tax=Condylostylus longicornis TaxID=2530218 RepID=UPI00244DECAA|nr:arfaptin-2 [Condylostylus longicornis]
MTSERTIHELLKDTPSSASAIQSGLALKSNNSAPTSPDLEKYANELTYVKNYSTTSKIDSLKNWSISTYKCTRQLMLEKLGKSQRTIDSDLEGQIEQLRETQRKYLSVLRLTRAFTSHFQNIVLTQHVLAECFSDLAQKSPELQQEFTCNSDTQKNLIKNGELLLNALNCFTSSINTLCNKTIDDTLITVRQYENARIEYDAYRLDVESNKDGQDIHQNYIKHKEQYEKLRNDVTVKMKFLKENRVKVMHKQLILLHNAIAAYFSGNAIALESTVKQFNIKLKTTLSGGSWLEN